MAKLLDDETWMRHANPWSVRTRYAAFPVLLAAVWSHHAIGWWALAPTALAVTFLRVNPWLFPRPCSTRNWASMAVLGERVWLAQDRRFLPEQDRTIWLLMIAASAVSLPALSWGLYAADLPLTLLAMVAILIGKTWFNDRMVWLFSVMKERNAEYAAWLY